MVKGLDFEFTNLACDTDASRIIVMTQADPKCVKELSELLDIPTSRCYRRVNSLLDMGMLKEADLQNGKGMKYSSNLDSLEMTIEDGELRIEAVFGDGRVKKGNISVKNEH